MNVFNPISLKPKVWLQSDSLQNSLNNNDQISLIKDLSGNGNDFTRSGVSRPYWYKTGAGEMDLHSGMVTPYNNGLDTSFRLDTSTWTIFLVERPYYTDFNRRSINGTEKNFIISSQRIGNGAYLDGSISHSFLLDRMAVTCLKTAKTGVEYSINGINLTEFLLANTSIGGFSIGSNSYVAEGAESYIIEVLIFDYSLSYEQKVLVETYLSNKYKVGYGVPAGAVPLVWLKADDIQLADSASVDIWPDASKKGNHLSQGTSSKRPVLKKNIINGHAVVRFDGVDDFLDISTLGVTNNEISAYMVCTLRSANDGQRLSAMKATADANDFSNTNAFLMTFTSSGRLQGYRNGSGYDVGPTEANKPFIVNMNWLAGNLYLSKNGVLITTVGQNAAFAGNQLFLGCGYENGTTGYAQIDIAEYILIDHTTSLVTSKGIHAYLAEKYGIIQQIAPYLWLDASKIAGKEGDSISTWNDRSGNNRNVTQTDPNNQPILRKGVLGGNDALEFDGSNDFMTLGSLSPQITTKTMFVVCSSDSLTPAGGATVASFTNGNNYSDLFDSLTFSEYSSKRWHNGSDSFNRTPNTVSVSDETSTNLIQLTYKFGPGDFVLRRNGTQIASTSTYSPEANAGTYLRVGMRLIYGGTSFGFWDGKIAEIIVFNRILTSDEILVVEAYLNSKYLMVIPA